MSDEAVIPCWQMKGCQVHKCVVHGKAVNCYATPNAGYAKKFCDGPMCLRLKNRVCPSCPVAKQWGLDKCLRAYSDEEIQALIESGYITAKKEVDT